MYTSHLKKALYKTMTSSGKREASLSVVFSILICLILSVNASAASEKNLISHINAESVSVLANPHLDAEVVVVLPRGEEIIVTNWQERGYSSVRCGEYSGFVKSNALKRPVTMEQFNPAEKGKITAESVNLRVRPETEASIASALKKGMTVDVLGYIDNWYRINAEGVFGYIHKDYVSVDFPMGDQLGGYKKLRMGMSGMEVAQLQQVLKDAGYYTGEVNGTYGARTRDALKLYQTDHGLTANGVADSDVQQMLFAS